MKIAVTSQNFLTVTPHAGKTRRFLVYELNPDGEVVETGRLDLDRVMTIHESRGSDAEHPLDQMDILITGSAGAGFVRQLNLRGVRVVLTGERDPLQAIDDLKNNQIKPPNPHACSHHHKHAHGNGCC